MFLKERNTKLSELGQLWDVGFCRWPWSSLQACAERQGSRGCQEFEAFLHGDRHLWDGARICRKVKSFIKEHFFKLDKLHLDMQTSSPRRRAPNTGPSRTGRRKYHRQLGRQSGMLDFGLQFPLDPKMHVVFRYSSCFECEASKTAPETIKTPRDI